MKKSTIILFLALVILFSFLLKIPTFFEPLSRDEGLYSYASMVMEKGGILYKDVFEFKPPLVFNIYQFTHFILGNTPFALRVFTAFYSLLSVFGIFLIGSCLFGAATGLIASLIFGVFSSGIILEGNLANTEVFMLFPFILSAYAFLLYLKKEKKWLIFVSGIFCAIAFLFKVVALTNFLLFASFLFFSRKNANKEDFTGKKLWLDLALLSSGFIFVIILVSLYFAQKGALKEFLYAVFIFGFIYVRSSFGFQYLYNLIANSFSVFCEGFLMWVTAVVSLWFILFQERRMEGLFIALWFVFSCFGVFAGGRFYEHYYIQLLPALSLLSAYFFAQARESILKKWRFIKPTKNLLVVFIFGSFILFIALNSRYYLNFFRMLSGRVSEVTYKSYFLYRNPIKIEAVSDFLKKNSKPEDYVYVWGAEPLVNYTSGRVSPTRYIINFHTDNIIGARQEVMKSLYLKKPCFIVLFLKPFPELNELLISRYVLLKEIEGVQIYFKRQTNLYGKNKRITSNY